MSSSSKRVGKQKAISTVDEINAGVRDMGFNSKQEDGWQVYAKNSKNKGVKQTVRQNPGPKIGKHNNITTTSPVRSHEWGLEKRNNINAGFFSPAAVPVPPALKNGWSWSTRAAASGHPTREKQEDHQHSSSPVVDDDDDDVRDNIELDSIYDSDNDDELLSDDDFDDSSSWFKRLFETLDSLSVAEINDPERQWHCPACKGGKGAIDWYSGLGSLITHAKTKGKSRVKLHRKLAELLEEELKQRTGNLVGEGYYGRWVGPEFKDRQIVWPPMAIVVNTKHEKDENDKWSGMGNQELLDLFSSFAAVKARHSYGPQGHRGVSVLIFEASAVGYAEAECLSNHFYQNGTGRDSWERNNPVRFCPGGKFKLYGYMATKRDIDNFNQHSPLKSRLKYEMRSYVEAVLNSAKKMSEENEQLIWFKNLAAKYQKQAQALEESNNVLSEKYRQALEENKILRQKTKVHFEQTKEEMEYQEEFIKGHLEIIYDAKVAKEDNLEKIQQE